MTVKTRLEAQWMLSFVALIATVLYFFHMAFGFECINPHHLNWLYYGDIAGNYFGWACFRMDPWTFPIGHMSSCGYPVGTNIGLTDSIPIAALFFKLFRFIDAGDFQYFGFWIFLNVMLQGMTGFYVAKKFQASPIQSFLIAVLLVLTPPFLFRSVMHVSLSTHWPIILCFAFLGNRSGTARWVWILLVAFMGLVHPYLWAIQMILYMLHEALIHGTGENGLLNKQSLIKIISDLGVVIGITVFLWAILGILFGFNYVVPGIGGHSANLLALVSPMEMSYFLAPLHLHYAGNFEGFGYLGLGGMILATLASLLWLRRCTRERNISRQTRYKLIFLFLVFFIAGSFVLSWGDHTIVDLFKVMRLFGAVSILSVFRATGRFIWIADYAVVIWAFALFTKDSIFLGQKKTALLLAVIVILQWIDLQPLYSSTRKTITEKASSDAPNWLNSQKWKELCGGKSVVNFFPAFYSIPWLRYAHDCGTKTNVANSARIPNALSQSINLDLESIRTGNLDPQTLYVFLGNTAEANEARESLQGHHGIHMEEIDGMLVISRLAGIP